MRRAVASLAFLLAAVMLAGREEGFEKPFRWKVSRVSVENVNGGGRALAWDKPYLKVARSRRTEATPKKPCVCRDRLRKRGRIR